MVGQTGGAVEGAATEWAGHGGGLVVGIGFSVIRAPILQTTATKSEIVGAGMLTGMIIRLVTPGAEIPFTKGAPKNGRLHVRSPGVGHRDHKQNTRRPYWRPPIPACIRAGPGQTGAARRRHTVPDGPRLSGGVPRLNSVGVATLAGRIATWGDFPLWPGR